LNKSYSDLVDDGDYQEDKEASPIKISDPGRGGPGIDQRLTFILLGRCGHQVQRSRESSSEF